MTHSTPVYPFGAIVGQERMKLALILNAVNPRIGGVLVRGERGTGKLASVRALAELLPEAEAIEGCPYSCNPADPLTACTDCRARLRRGEAPDTVKRPVIVTVVPSSIMVEDLVGRPDGRGGFVPGLLARANRGILYAEGVDRMSDKASDALFAAAHTGAVVAAAGVVYPSRFVFTASIDRPRDRVTPALLDRFGLCVNAETIHEREDRLRILQYHAAFDAAPGAFLEKFEPDQSRLHERIVRAIEALPLVTLDDAVLTRIAAFCEAAGLEGHRADVAVTRTARTVAAFDSSRSVREDDVRAALELAMPHRMEPRLQGSGLQTGSDMIQKTWAQTSREASAMELLKPRAQEAPARRETPKSEWDDRGGRGRRGGAAAAKPLRPHPRTRRHGARPR